MQVYLKATLIAAALGLSTTSLAYPSPLSPRQSSTLPNITVIDYEAGFCDSGGVAVSYGTFGSGYCLPVLVDSYKFPQLPNNNCSFTLYDGTHDCNTTLPHVTQVGITQIPAGNGTKCVVGGVETGGEGVDGPTRSGRYSCDV